MKHLFCTALIATAPLLAPAPALAEDKPADQLLRLFELFSDETETILDDLMAELGPALETFGGIIDDFSFYSAPEVLPNGDIIIRRKPNAPKPELPDGQIEL